MEKSFSEKLLSAAILCLTLILFVLALASSAFAGTDLDPVLEELTIAAMADMSKGKTEDALEKLTTVHGHAPMASIAYLIAECHLKLEDFDQAEKFLSSAAIDIIEDSSAWEVLEGPAPIKVYQQLGKVAFSQGRYQEALKNFNVYLARLTAKADHDKVEAMWTQEAISMCESLIPGALSQNWGLMVFCSSWSTKT